MSGDLLVLNSGSSSLKFALYEIDPDSRGADPDRHLKGQITGLDATPHFSVEDASGNPVEDRQPAEDGGAFGHEQALEFLIDWLDETLEGRSLLAAGHRVVHGGQDFVGPVRMTAERLEQMEALVPLARCTSHTTSHRSGRSPARGRTSSSSPVSTPPSTIRSPGSNAAWPCPGTSPTRA